MIIMAGESFPQFLEMHTDTSPTFSATNTERTGRNSRIDDLNTRYEISRKQLLASNYWGDSCLESYLERRQQTREQTLNSCSTMSRPVSLTILGTKWGAGSVRPQVDEGCRYNRRHVLPSKAVAECRQSEIRSENVFLSAHCDIQGRVSHLRCCKMVVELLSTCASRASGGLVGPIYKCLLYDTRVTYTHRGVVGLLQESGWWLRHTSRAFQIAVSSQVKFDEICPAPSLILMFVSSCSIMLIPAPPLLRVRSEDPSVYAVEGRGLAILIKNLYYEDIAVNITNTLDLEAQEIAPRPKLAQLRKILELQNG
ncbi:hypothetical protein LAZ67_18002360 [Cordylochernes scorpioides]|uniref:Uncharacterized protein n=1 Tax=Cordylochernes scorpioides TaxID=51811 RepID=A0ABY6LIP8_9ARAC|nr:hypothetical protein LAZ67_18002360 [Cordylochernes scorpioides]